MRKRIKSFSFVLIMLLLLSSGNHTGHTKALAETGFEVTDCIGRKVVIPAKINRIACLYAFSGHVTVVLERCKDIVAVVNGLKRDKILTTICPAISEATVPKYNGALNIEELARVKPDVVFMKESAFYERGDFERIKKFGIPVIVISFNSIIAQINAVRIMGEVLSENEKAEKYISYYRECLGRAEQIVAKIPDKKRTTVYHSVLEPLKTDTRESLSADWIENAGLINVSARANLKQRGEDAFAGIEQVILWNPEAIIVNEEGVDNYILNNTKWKNIQAVKNKRVYKMPTGISRWGHPGSLETPLAVLWALKTFYPGLSEEIDLVKETKYFYNTFFGFNVSDKMIDKILRGEGMRMKKNKKRKYR